MYRSIKYLAGFGKNACILRLSGVVCATADLDAGKKVGHNLEDASGINGSIA